MNFRATIKTAAYLLFLSQAAYGSSNSEPACEITGISGLWQDNNGKAFGSSRMEWLNCSDGHSYSATCAHRGSGDSMELCSCMIDASVYEQNCGGLVSSPSLGLASQQCCGFSAIPGVSQ